MRARSTYGFAARDASNVVPNNFFIAKRGPTVGTRFRLKLLKSSASRCHEQRLPSDGVIIRRLFRPIDFFQEGRRKEISRIFRVMTIEVTDSISGFVITVPTQLFLDGRV